MGKHFDICLGDNFDNGNQIDNDKGSLNVKMIIFRGNEIDIYNIVQSVVLLPFP